MRVRRGCGHRGHSPVPRRSPAGAGKPGWRGSERFSMQSLRPPWWAPVQWAAFSTLSRGGHLEGGTQPITRSILPPLGGICESPRGHKLWPPPESLSHGAPALGNPTEWGQGPLGLAHPTWPALGVKPTMGCRPVGSPPPCLQLSRTPLSCQPRKLPGAWEEHQKDLVGRREGAGASSASVSLVGTEGFWDPASTRKPPWIAKPCFCAVQHRWRPPRMLGAGALRNVCVAVPTAGCGSTPL
ncbi:uncharacterized protein [Symphalangus syndactylus]|uniref:uncharacterized protein isoform X3 n=1 Tax=Symphalangus syndactylus TaxID=9590 RepID=UPI0024427197|nr:uncharacterized protein LOC129472210 isoform X2 [Symphalangus syndactylus]